MTIDWLSTASVLGLAFVFGLKHALDADHLTAVFAIVSERKSLLGSSAVGVLWGLGHTAALMAAGVAVVCLQLRMSERVSVILEGGVAIMLVGLGMHAMRSIRRGGIAHIHVHEHGIRRHVHPHLHHDAREAAPHTHHGLDMSPRPVLVGMVHGLAGSAGLTLLVVAAIPSRLLALAYVAVFGLGSIVGMLFMSAIAGLPFRLTADRFSRANAAVRAIAGAWSIAFGLFLAYELRYGVAL